TILSTKIDTPFVVANHEPNGYGPRNLNTARRVAKSAKPSPTVVSGGLVPGSDDAPFVRGAAIGTRGQYGAMLSAELPRAAPLGVGLRLASFFCGCGGVDLGFRSAGFELAFANDYYDKAASSFERNLGHRPILGD